MAKLFIPKVGDLIRVTDNITIALAEDAYGHLQRPAPAEVYRLVYGEAAYEWQRAYEIINFTLPKGTVLKFKRLFVSSHAKQNAIEVSIFAHPDPLLTPRPQGGKLKGGVITMTLTTDQLNKIEYERVIL